MRLPQFSPWFWAMLFFLLADTRAAFAQAPVIYEEIDPYSLRAELAQPIQAKAPRGRYAMDGEKRAGHPQSISRLAAPSVTRGDSAGWVGGGTVLRGQPRNIQQDGVWGFDYDGWILNRCVWLGWTHGRRPQGGMRGYKTDGPRLELAH